MSDTLQPPRIVPRSASRSRTRSMSPSRSRSRSRSMSPSQSPSQSQSPLKPVSARTAEDLSLRPAQMTASASASASPSRSPQRTTLPRLILKTHGMAPGVDALAAAAAHSRQGSGATTAGASTIRSGSVSPRERERERGYGEGTAALVEGSRQRPRQRTYSEASGSIDEGSADGSGGSGSQASMPPAEVQDTGEAEGDTHARRDRSYPPVGASGRISPQIDTHHHESQHIPSWHYRASSAHRSAESMQQHQEMSRAASAGVASAVLPPLPRTTKVVTPIPTAAAATETPVRAKGASGAGGSGGAAGGSASGSKSRKSSCDLCHHRKIRCDQARPACGSCARKGHVCVYADDAERPPSKPTQQSNRSITVVSASNPAEKTVMTIPRPEEYGRPAGPPSGGRSGPEWAVRSGLATPISAVAPYDHSDPTSFRRDRGEADRSVNGSVSGGRSKKNQRERILNGFDSDSEDERVRLRAMAGQDGRPDVPGVSESRDGAAGGASIDGELAELAAVKPEEVDELESEDERDRLSGARGSAAPSIAASGVSESQGGKRGTSGDEELNGELLELASGPPKKKKARTSIPAITTTLPLRPNHAAYRPSSRNGTSHPISSSTSRRHPPGSTLVAATPLSSNPPSQLGVAGGTASANSGSAGGGKNDPYTSSLTALMASLPSGDIQRILFDAFFVDPFLNEGITLLQPQFYEDLKSLLERKGSKAREGDATTLANAFAMLAAALRIMPDETSRLLLASSPTSGIMGPGGSGHPSAHPKSLSRILAPQLSSIPDTTPLDQRYFDLALICSQLAESADSPSVMLVMLKVILYRFAAIRKDKNVIAGQYLGGAIRIAQALGMGKEWEGIPQGERELRRRVMWCLYIADRHLSFETAFPYTILDAHQGIHLPSPISEADLYKIAKDAQSLPPHSTEVGPTPCTALFIHTHLARRITPILDSFATISPSHTPHDLVLRFDQSLDNFQDALPPYMRLFPSTDTRFDATHPYLASHRIRLHATLLAYRQGVHRSFIATYLRPSAPPGIRGVMASICLASLRTQRSAKMLDPKIAPRIFDPLIVFESAMILAMVLYVDRAISGKSPIQIGAAPEGMMWREGVANGMELLDNVAAVSGGDTARRGVRVLRELCVKVDAPVVESSLEGSSSTNGHLDTKDFDRDSSRPRSSSGGPRPASRSGNARTQAVDAWLDGLAQERRTMEVLLRDPHWTGAWERVLAAM